MDLNDEINIHLLSTLNYLELRELCSSDKYYNKLCSNNNLRYILQTKNKNLIIPKNIDISKVLNNIYNEAAKTVDNSYNIPVWVNKDIFKKVMIYKILVNYMEYLGANYIDEDTIEEYLITYYVHDIDIIMPFTTKTMDNLQKQQLADHTDTIILHIPKSFYHYILPTLHHLYTTSKPDDDLYDIFMPAMMDLLFISNF